MEVNAGLHTHLLIPYTICVPFKAAGGCPAQGAAFPPCLPLHLQAQTTLLRDPCWDPDTEGLGDNRQDLPADLTIGSRCSGRHRVASLAIKCFFLQFSF